MYWSKHRLISDNRIRFHDLLLYLYCKFFNNATEPTNISIERVLKQDIPDIVSYCNHILLVDNLSDMRLFSHPARLRATTVLVCTQGIIESSINLKNYTVAENHLLVNFSGDIIQIHRTENVRGYAIILSEEYLREVQLDFRMRAQSYMNIRGNGPVAVPRDELTSLKPYYRLFKKIWKKVMPM